MCQEYIIHIELRFCSKPKEAKDPRETEFYCAYNFIDNKSYHWDLILLPVLK